MNAVVALAVVAVFWILPIYVAYQIGKPKSRSGFAWGLFLGWLGVLVVALLPAREGVRPAEPFFFWGKR